MAMGAAGGGGGAIVSKNPVTCKETYEIIV